MRREQGWRSLGVGLLVILASISGGAPAQAAVGAVAVVTPANQYAGLSTAQVLRFTVTDQSTSGDSTGSVLIAPPSNQWTVVACAAPKPWKGTVTGGDCSFASPAGATGNLMSGSAAVFRVTVHTGASAVNVAGTWAVGVDANDTFDGGANSAAASPTGRGLGTIIFPWQVVSASIAASAPIAGSACPPQGGTAASGTAAVVVVCGIDHAAVSLKPVAGRSNLTGTLIAAKGTFASGTVSAGVPLVVATYAATQITTTVGSGLIVKAKVGSSVNATSPVTTLTGFATCDGTLIEVSAASGSDANPGTCTAPYKTLTTALAHATSGRTVQVDPGTYDATNGEAFPLNLPAGVTVRGNPDSLGAGTVVAGAVGLGTTNGGLYGLTLGGEVDATGSNEVLASSTLSNGSGTCILATAGSLLLQGDNITGCAVGVIVQGASVTVNATAITADAFGIEDSSGSLDLGGGSGSSTGGNTISCSTSVDIYITNTSQILSAEFDRWDHTPPTVAFGGSPPPGIDIWTFGQTATTLGATVAPNHC